MQDDGKPDIPTETCGRLHEQDIRLREVRRWKRWGARRGKAIRREGISHIHRCHCRQERTQSRTGLLWRAKICRKTATMCRPRKFFSHSPQTLCWRRTHAESHKGTRFHHRRRHAHNVSEPRTRLNEKRARHHDWQLLLLTLRRKATCRRKLFHLWVLRQKHRQPTVWIYGWKPLKIPSRNQT